MLIDSPALCQRRNADIPVGFGSTHEDDYTSSILVGEQEDTPVFQQHNALLHGRRQRQLFSIGFLKKFLMYAKHRVHPELLQEAADILSAAYVQLRTTRDMKVC